MASMSRTRAETDVVFAFRRRVDNVTVAGFGAALQAVRSASRETVQHLRRTAVCFTVAAPWSARRRTLLSEFVERFDRVVEVRRVDLRGARLAGTRDVDVAAGLPERHSLFLLPVVELHRHRQRRFVE